MNMRWVKRIVAFLHRLLLFVLALSHVNLGLAQTSFGLATANILDSGIINAHYTISSNHFAFIFNDSTIANVYLYEFDLCAQNFTCTVYPFSAVLQPHEGINISFIAYKDVIYSIPGRYVLTAKTVITGSNVNVLAQGLSHALIIDPNVLPP